MILRARSWRGLLSRDHKSRKTFHVKHSQRRPPRCFRNRPRPLINVNGLGSSSLTDTKFAKDHVENVLDIDPTQQPPQSIGGPPQLLGRQFLTLSDYAGAPPQRFRGLPQQRPLPLPGDQASFLTA